MISRVSQGISQNISEQNFDKKNYTRIEKYQSFTSPGHDPLSTSNST